MSKSIVRCLTALVLAAVCLPAFADVKLPEIFSTNMVVQQEMPVSVWGWADAGEEITVSFDTQSVKTITGKDGKWSLKLQPLKANAKPQTFTVKGKNEIKLENVLIGEVWLCSGQSNMEWTMARSAEYKDELPKTDNPKIRLFHVAKAWNVSPQDSLSATWKQSNPENIPNFSAVGYYFGQKLAADLDVPVGLIHSSWGGTRIEPWTTPEGFNSVPALKSLAADVAVHDVNSPAHRELVAETLKKYQDWIDANEKVYSTAPVENAIRNANQRNLFRATRRNNAAPTSSAKSATRITPPPAFPAQLNPYTRNQDPTVLYNAMINPFAGLAIRGAIWYQGESNNGEGALYGEKMKALINGWRKTFNPELGFYWVQIAPFDYGGQRKGQLPELQVAQSSVEKSYSYKHVGQAVINDLVTNVKDIHPPKKLTVGNRLALLALNRTYGKTNIVCASPEFDKIEIKDTTVVLTFKNAKELKTRDGQAPTWFEVAGADGIYRKANAVIEGTTIKLTSPEVPHPYAARFAWDQIAEPNVENEAGLPLGAFKAGEVPVRAAFDELVPQGKNFKLVYAFDPTNLVMNSDNSQLIYSVDKSGEIKGNIKKVGYFLYLTGNDPASKQFVFVTMSPLEQNVAKIGVPTKSTGVVYQQAGKDVAVVASNVAGVETGAVPNSWLEFWSSNYGQQNEKQVPGASGDKFDFGDMRAVQNDPGYGCMQIHDIAKKQTIFAFNNFVGGGEAGIGNNPAPKGNPDWTFAKNNKETSYTNGQFLIFVEQ